jgi:hypothetical protein
MKHHRTTLMLALVFLITLGACSSATPTEPPTSTPEPIPPTATLEPTPEAIPATQELIQVGDFEFRIIRKAYDSVIGGLVPNGMGGDRILLIEFELSTGENSDFANLEPVVVLEGGDVREPIAAIYNNSVNTMTSMTFTGDSGFYTPGEGTVTLAYIAPSQPGQITLEFLSGEVIDLTPLYE